MKYVEYIHYGNKVKVRKELKGHHKRYCLCFAPCKHFKPDDENKYCDIARAVYDNCVKFGIVTPMWECPKFVEKPVE